MSSQGVLGGGRSQISSRSGAFGERPGRAPQGGQLVVSVHLRVLREVGLVEVPDEHRQRRYRLGARPLKPIHDWVGTYLGLLAAPRTDAAGVVWPLSYSGGAFVDDLTAGDGHVDVHVGHQPVAGGEQVAVKHGQVAAVADL